MCVHVRPDLGDMNDGQMSVNVRTMSMPYMPTTTSPLWLHQNIGSCPPVALKMGANTNRRPPFRSSGDASEDRLTRMPTMYTVKTRHGGIWNVSDAYSEPEYKTGYLMTMSSPLFDGSEQFRQSSSIARHTGHSRIEIFYECFPQLSTLRLRSRSKLDSRYFPA